jgi:hypothetical protein
MRMYTEGEDIAAKAFIVEGLERVGIGIEL